MTVKELKEIMKSLPDKMEVVCLAGEFDIKTCLWPIDDYFVIDTPKAHEGLYLHHE